LIKVEKFSAILRSSEGVNPRSTDITVATVIEILLLTLGIITETESFIGSVKKIMIITRI
jgi:hypothetical protein